MMKRIRWILLLGVLLLSWQLLRAGFPEEEREVRSQLRESLAEVFPGLAQQASERFGIRRLGVPRGSRPEVLLLHGLDDPGRVWMTLAPVLLREGYGVLLLDYPNDQAIADSAAFVARQMQVLAGQGLGQVDIVAHSMGGLVSREMLTSPALRCDPPQCQRPGVRQLIMVGTPNHGSDLARWRALGEVREQFSRLFSGEAGWLDWIFDGAGEAGLDLLPDSAFLNDLNARPAPQDTQMFVIAGEIGQAQWDELEGLLQQHAEQLPPALQQVRTQIGDGLVSVDSAHLPGAPLFRVPGNHLSIIRNVFEGSERTPPAIPIVLHLLGDGGSLPGQRTND
jgi:pimeloyl-ACP methyl ester carboxylesterase